jgi:hypothetical protein
MTRPNGAWEEKSLPLPFGGGFGLEAHEANSKRLPIPINNTNFFIFIIIG